MASYRYERNISPEDLVPEKTRELTPAEARANWWHYHWYYVVLIAAAVLAVGYFVWSRVTEVKPDYTVAVVGRIDPDAAFLSEVETKLEAAADDVNGDGKVKVNVKSIWLALDYDGQDSSLRKLMESSEDKLNSDFYLCESMIFIVDEPGGKGAAVRLFSVCWTVLTRRRATASVSDFAVLLDDTALAGVQSKSGAEWYVARRLSEGVEEESLTTGDALWEKLI